MRTERTAPDTAAARITQELTQRSGSSRPLLVCLDGRCGSGKSTLAALIAERLPLTVVHADDFYLQPAQRTAARYAQPGGNLDRERLRAEILEPLRRTGTFSYRPYDAHTDTFGPVICGPHSSITLVEGSYSAHPDLWAAYDLHIFLTTDPHTQMERIRRRNGERAAEIFSSRWIPLEERYIRETGLQERCELCFET